MSTTTPVRAWNTAILERHGSFLQSFEWGVFQEALGHHVVRVGYGTFYGQAIEQTLPFGIRYAYVPRGPVGVWAELEFDDWLATFRDEVFPRRFTFARIDPPLGADPAILRRNRFVDTGRTVQPRKNLVVSLIEPEETILGRMHEKTRYNIRVAERHGVEVGIKNNELGFAAFCGLLEETASRQKIRLHPKNHYETMLRVVPAFSDGSRPPETLRQRLYVVRLKDDALAAALIVYFGNRATYVHGGTSLRQKNAMASYALHWHIMREAKAAGCEVSSQPLKTEAFQAHSLYSTARSAKWKQFTGHAKPATLKPGRCFIAMTAEKPPWRDARSTEGLHLITTK